MSTIILTQYNNYYNRVIKKNDYASHYYGSKAKAFTDVNFNPNDGVTTTLTVNWEESYAPDYLVVCDTNNVIQSRWFVLEMARNRAGQYVLSLRRDLLADYYDETMDSTCFIQKGWVDSSNPLIFNPEGVTVNKIQEHEILLRDSTRAAWIVGYVAPNLADFDTENGTSTAVNELTIELTYPQETIPDISTFEYDQYIDKTVRGYINTDKSYYALLASDWTVGNRLVVLRYLDNKGEIGRTTRIPYSNMITVTNRTKQELANASISLNSAIFNTALNNALNDSTLDAVLKLNQQVYKDGDTYKKFVVEQVKGEEEYYELILSRSEYPNIIQAIENSLAAANLTYKGDDVLVLLYCSSFTCRFEEVATPFTTGSITFKKSNRALYDAPYKMFCIPVTADEAVVKVGDNTVLTTKDKMLQIAASIATGLGSNLYDIQLLPYCPIENQFEVIYTEQNGIEYLGGTVDLDYTVMTDNETPIGYIFWCPRASFTTTITTNYIQYPQLNYNNPLEFKVGNESTYMRLVAPNYANYEDINYFMNYGIDYINIDCTYKPITPYVKLNINYKGLYGKDFDNNRGLILGGDYSLPIMSDAWVNYQIQNKNYSNIFDRETQHLEYQHKWQTAAAITGAITGTAQGALMGNFLGKKNGGVAGGIVAAATGALDIAQTVVGFHESMDYRRDNYEMQLQNIQAIPQGLVKTSAFNYNSKMWPMIEIYHCTDTEKELLRNKIRYSGMTINAIGKLSDYLNPSGETYIQGKVIRIDSGDEYHLTKEINNELNMGVYI